MLLSNETLAILFVITSLTTKLVVLPLVNKIHIPYIEPQIDATVPIPLNPIPHAHLNGQQPAFNVDVRNLNINELLTNYAYNPGLPNDYWNLLYILFCTLTGICVLKRFLSIIQYSLNDKAYWWNNFGIFNTSACIEFIFLHMPTLTPIQFFFQSLRTISHSFLFIDNPLIYVGWSILHLLIISL